jgi:hypothetical protein
MHGTLIESDTVGSRGTPAWLILSIKAAHRGASHGVRMTLVEALELLGRGVEGRLYSRKIVSLV